MMRTVFAECKLNVPFVLHPKVVSLIKSNDGNLGSHHADKTNAKRMLVSMSELMYIRLLRHLTSPNIGPFAIIADGSTTYHGDHYLITYIRALESDDSGESMTAYRPVVYFYKLLKMDEVSEKAKNYMQKIEDALNEDKTKYVFDMPTAFKKNLIAFGADGASVMSGRQGGLIKKLEEYVGRSLIFVHCMAHRLQLAVGRAWGTEGHFKDMEILINSVHNFYYNRGHKRKSHLEKTVETMSETFYRFKQIFKVRWIASEKKALENVLKSWKVLAVDLNEIAENKESEFNPNTAAEARGLFNKLTERHVLVYLNFIFDILTSLGLLSEKMQGTAGILPTLVPVIEGFRESMNTRKTVSGFSEVSFLKKVKCSDETETGEYHSCTTLQNYYTSATVKWDDIEFPIKQRTRNPDLREQRGELIQKLLTEFDKYFPRDQTIEFSIFEPKKLPTSIFDVDLYGIQEITELSSHLQLDIEESVNQWRSTLRSIVENEEFNKLRQSSALNFWSYYLAEKNTPWLPEVRKILQAVLIIPVGSADAERGFSILNHAKYDRRSLLQHKALDALNFWSYYLAEKNTPWLPEVRKILQAVLIIPVGSADAERGFSILNHAKYDRRSLLQHEALDAILRVRINGPELEDFAGLPYAKHWVNTGHWLTDSRDIARNPKAGMTAKEREVVDGVVDEIYEAEEAKKFLRKSNLF